LNRVVTRPDRFRDNPWAYRNKKRAVAWVNRLFLGEDPEIDRLIAEVASGQFAASNRRTAEMTGLDLAALGYET